MKQMYSVALSHGLDATIIVALPFEVEHTDFKLQWLNICLQRALCKAPVDLLK